MGGGMPMFGNEAGLGGVLEGDGTPAIRRRTVYRNSVFGDTLAADFMSSGLPSFEDWKRNLRGSHGARKMSDADKRIVYQAAVNLFRQTMESDPIDSNDRDQLVERFARLSDQSYGELVRFRENPTAETVPSGTRAAQTTQGRTVAAKAQKDVNEAKKDEGSSTDGAATAQEAVNRELFGEVGNFFPWMAGVIQQGVTNPFSKAGGGTAEPSDDQMKLFMYQWNREHPDERFSDVEKFRRDRRIIEGDSAAQGAFSRALNTGMDEQLVFGYYGTRSPDSDMLYQGGGNYTFRSGIYTADATVANSAARNGKPEFDRYWEDIARSANSAGVPWQLVWGVMRAKAAFDPKNRGDSDNPFNIDPALSSGAPVNARSAILWFGTQIAEGYRQTGDWALAALYAQGRAGQESALHLRATGKSAPGRAAADAAFLGRVYGDNKQGMLELPDIGFGRNGEFANAKFNVVMSQPGAPGAGTQVVKVPDMALLREQADSMVRSLLFREPSAGEVDQLANSMRSAVIQAQMQANNAEFDALGNQFEPGYSAPQQVQVQQQEVDPQARMLEQIKGGAEYKDLYGKRGGLSEGEYAAQFQQVNQDMLGNANAEQGLLREGLRSGDVQTYQGIVAGSGMSNVTFRQRLYEAAQAIANI